MSLSSFCHGVALLVLMAVTPIAVAEDSAQVAKGKELYDEFCKLCHGADGKRGEGFQNSDLG